jgi:hypothetical protein
MFYFEFLISVCVASFIGKDLAPMQGTANAMLLRPRDLRVRSPELRGEHGSQRRSCHAVVIFCLKKSRLQIRVIPAHRNHSFDPASVFLSTH